MSSSSGNSKKRLRLPNWTEQQKTLLKRICQDYQEIIDSKKNDSATIVQKELAWEKVAEKLIARGLHHVTPQKCKEMWNRMKIFKRSARRSEDVPMPKSPKLDDEEMDESEEIVLDYPNDSGDTKRARLPNWSEKHKALLKRICQNNKDIIDSKKNDSNTIFQKELAWEAIAKKIKARGQPVTPQKCKEMWNRMKVHQRSTRSNGNVQNSQSVTLKDEEGNESEEILPDEPDDPDESDDYVADQKLFSKVGLEIESNPEDLESSVPNDVQSTLSNHTRNPQRRNAAHRRNKLENIMISHRIKQIKAKDREINELRKLKIEFEKKRIAALDAETALNLEIGEAKLKAQKTKQEYYELKCKHLSTEYLLPN